jgi:HEAT repeat protein
LRQAKPPIRNETSRCELPIRIDRLFGKDVAYNLVAALVQRLAKSETLEYTDNRTHPERGTLEKPEPDATERLIIELKDDRRDVRSRAAYELGKHSDPRAIAPLIVALADNDKFVKSWAAGALGKAGPLAVEPLLSALTDKDPSVAYYAALALGEIGDLRSVPVLVKALSEGDYDIRPSAAGILAGLGDQVTLPSRVLSDSALNAADREEILHSLNNVNYSDEEQKICYCVPDVRELCRECLQSEDAQLRSGAAEVLQELESSRPPEPQQPVVDPRVEPQPIVPAEPEKSPTHASHKDAPKRSLWSRLTGR